MSIFEDSPIWTIHGLWPSKYGSKGPNGCQTGENFDIEKLQSILEDLKKFWPDVLKRPDPNSFWKHEWEKHGTCATEIEAIENQLEYFKKGLELNWIHSIEKYLENFGINPGDSYTADNILNSISTQTGSQAAIQCDKFGEKFFLREIRICFDKNFGVVTCKNIYQGVYGSCPKEGLILYPRDLTNTSNGKKKNIAIRNTKIHRTFLI